MSMAEAFAAAKNELDEKFAKAWHKVFKHPFSAACQKQLEDVVDRRIYLRILLRGVNG